MTHPSPKQARAEAMLGELAELALGVARDLAVRTRASEDTEETVALAEAFHKVSRVVRLTLALDFKLERDAAREARDAAREAEVAEAERAEAAAARERQAAILAPRPHDPVRARKDRVGNLLNRLLWNECEGDTEDYEVLTDDLTARLDEAARSDDFMTLPVEVIARRVMADMGLSGKFALSLCEGSPRAAPATGRSAALADSS